MKIQALNHCHHRSGIRLLVLAGLGLLPLSVFAADATDSLSYGYVELDYINLDIDQPNDDVFDRDFDNGDGYGVSLSVPFGEAFFAYADYSDTKADFTFVTNNGTLIPGDTDMERVNLGIGFIAPMSDQTDLVLSGGYSDIDFGNFSFGATDSDDSLNDLREDPSDGFTADVRLRSQLSQMIEGSLGARYTEIEDADGVSLVGNLMFEFSPNWGLNLSLDAGDELLTYGAGVRYSF